VIATPSSPKPPQGGFFVPTKNARQSRADFTVPVLIFQVVFLVNITK
jgi:hypothetical protein